MSVAVVGWTETATTLPLVAEGTCYSVEFADFLKKMVGHLPSDGPMRGALLPD